MISPDARCWLCGQSLWLARHGLCSCCRRRWRTPCLCPRCGLPGSHEALPCGQCLLHPPPWQALLAVSDYAPPLSLLLARFKFQRQTALAQPLAREILLRWRQIRYLPGFRQPDLLLPVPLHARRAWRRGYNQAALLARPLARWIGCDWQPQLLRRRRNTAAQSRLSARRRRRNLRGAFSCHPSVAGKHIVVLDDVITTGSTAAEISRLLHKKGAASVQVWCLCRTLSTRPEARKI